MAGTEILRPEERPQDSRKNIASFLVPEIIIAELPIQGRKLPTRQSPLSHKGYSLTL